MMRHVPIDFVCAVFMILVQFCLVNCANKPNILFIMADDLGWNDVSWHNDKMHTPNIDWLSHNNAVILNQSYVNQLCSPTRSAMLSGFYPFRIGTQHGVFYGMEPSGVPIKFKFYPEDLKTLGYKTYMVGKWHLGYCNASYLPTKRGFDTFDGYYMGSEDYFTHTYCVPAFGRNNCGYDFWHATNPDYPENGTYSTEVFEQKADTLLRQHNNNTPFYMYFAFQAPHWPLQVPERYLEACNQSRSDRRVYCGMVNALDEAVGKIIDTLKALNYYNNTIIIFSTDNGGQTLDGGNNYPLRGNKNTLWEGGNRAISFVHSPSHFNNASRRTSLFHIVDWYATILAMSGKQNTRAFGDGLNQWDMIRFGDDHGKRNSLVYNIDTKGAAYREGRFKLILGDAGKPDGWIPPETAANDSDLNRASKKVAKVQLFDLFRDPTEHKDLSKLRPRVVMRLRNALTRLKAQAVPSIHRGLDIRGDPRNFNGTFASGWC